MNTKCHLCGCAMTIDMEPNEFMTAERIASLATCVECCRKRGDRRPKSELTSKPETKTHLPYVDD